jgi:hypothetical protein
VSLEHTSKGLSNLRVLSGVDAIVYVEGGSSQSVDQVEAGRFESESMDIAFWQKCFSELGSRLSLKFLAVGAKPTLRAIAQKIVKDGVTGVYVAMDRDFDSLLGKTIQHPRVLYTYGYSWENDVWKREVLEEVFYTLCPVCRNTVVVSPITTAAMHDFERDIRWPTYADLICFMHDIPLLPRRSAQRIITTGRGAAPAINKSALRQCFRDAKLKRAATAVAATIKIRTRPLVDCCGHVVCSFGHCLLRYLFGKFCKGTSYPNEVFDTVAIDKFFERLKSGSFEDIRAHYQRQVAA